MTIDLVGAAALNWRGTTASLAAGWLSEAVRETKRIRSRLRPAAKGADRAE
jgi:hypothetical protein